MKVARESANFRLSLAKVDMKVFPFLFIGLLLIFQRSYGEEKLVKEGGAKSWYYTYIDTSNKEGASAGWSELSNTFGSIDKENGAWLVTKDVQCDQRCTMPCVTVNYHVDIKAKITRCHNTTCSLQIFIYNRTEELDIPDAGFPVDVSGRRKQQMYLLNNFLKLHDVTFIANKKIETQSFNFSYNCCVDISYNCSKIRFGIRARAIAGEFHNMKFYFYYCKETLKNGVRLAGTYAPSSGLKRVAVNCTSNAVSKYNGSSFEGLCWYNGTWNIGNDTECYCRPGYGMSRGCKRCLKEYYKPKISNEGCTLCPARSTSNSTNTACNCLEEKYRLKNETGISSAPCYGFPSKVRNINVEKGDSRRTFTLSWEPPLEQGGLPRSLKYDVGCGDECELKFTPRKVNLINTTVEISGFTPGHDYNFKVFSKNTISVLYGNGRFEFANITFKLPRGRFNRTNEFMIKLEYRIVAGIGALFILILIIALVCTLRRKRHRHSKCDFPDNGITLPDIGQKMYVDPLNYVDAETALKDFANEIDPASLSLERLIGGGEFGDVYKGELTLQDGKTILIAAKTLKPNASVKSCQDFFLEASAMGQFDDPNVIHLEGVITKVVPKMIVTEFMLNGSLDHFLKKNDGGFTAIQLFSMARGVASGMKYLASINFVHRDLAARNILVDENMICKVADFGLSRELETTDSSRGEYFTQGGKIPVRWTAPEAIKYRIFSTASDVWSFGILLWEIMSSAQRPYWDWDNFKVMERVDDGFRLPSPMNCPQAVHELMLKCWDKDRRLRPCFQDILVTIDKWIESPEIFHQPNMPDRSNQVPHTRSTTSVKEWLDEIKMSSYMPHFAAAGYEQLSDLAGLLDNDLKALGISLVGHRNKMLRIIRSLPIIQENNL